MGIVAKTRWAAVLYFAVTWTLFADPPENIIPIPGMVFIRAGTFLMGSPDNEAHYPFEGPQTRVTISRDFWMSKYETTQGKYLAVMGNNPSYFQGDLNCPVEAVSWHDATNYCGKLTASERAAGRLAAGYVYRLPTDAEWEYCCRAGTTTPLSYGDGSSYTQLGDYAWFDDNSYTTVKPSGGSWIVNGGRYYTTHPVGQKLPNAWGLYDMLGNVTEWCMDWYSGSLPGGSVTDPLGADTGMWRLDRGGNWGGPGWANRSTIRNQNLLDIGITAVGFRLILAPELANQAVHLTVVTDQADPVPGMVAIPPGTFLMGSPASEVDRTAAEVQTPVTFSQSFWMSRYETTQGEYQAVMGTNPSCFPGDAKRPVEQVTWYDAAYYCDKLTAIERAAGRLPAGYVYRLPTEVEWEYCCRAGTTTATAYGDSLSSTQANFEGDYPYGGAAKGPYLGATRKVGSYAPNAWGLYDMHGNVWEWCLNWGGTYLGWNVSENGPDNGSIRTFRGGGWGSAGSGCRSALWYGNWPGYWHNNLGFRPVLALAQTAATISWPSPADITYGTALGNVQLNATANLPGIFVYSPAAVTVLEGGDGQSMSVTFTPTDPNYSAATATVSINVLKAASSITWANPADISYGTALGNGQLNATASVPGSFVYTPAVETVLKAGAGQLLRVSFTPIDTNYIAATATVRINVLKAILRVEADGADRTYGTTNPIFHGNISGFVNGDTVAAVSGAPAFTCSATMLSSVGTYDIVPALGTLSAANYSFVTTNLGTLRVTNAPLVVHAENRTRRYGETNPVFSVTVTGLRNGDPITVSYGCPAGTDSPAGGYPIVPTLIDPAGKLANYMVTIENGILTVIASSSLRGRATDALSKQLLAGVRVSLGGLSQTTGPDGTFVFTNLAPGGLEANFTASSTVGPAPLTVRFSNTSRDSAYLLQAEKTGYARYSYAPIELASGEDKEWIFSMSPNFQGLRLVLNWGSNPKDLDSHLITPKINGTNYHIWYANPYTGKTNLPPYAQLDADETKGFGPETITVASNVPGIYRYYVHNYKEEQGNTGELTNSVAAVQIYSTAGLEATVRVPEVGAGDYWDVCAIDGASGKITLLNQIVTREPRSDDDGTVPPNSGDHGGANTNSQPKLVWNFGDQSASDQENPTNVFLKEGTYTVSLQITMPDGRIATVTQPALITVTGSAGNAPQLTIARVSGDVLVSWQTTETGFVLESRLNLFAGGWLPVVPVPTVSANSTYSVRIPLTGQQYFRLRR